MGKTSLKYLLLSLAVAPPLLLQAQSSPLGGIEGRLTLAEATLLLFANSPEIRLGEAEVKAAEGELRQSRAWANPEVTVMHNVNNPATHRYFETGREGETDVQLSQRIFIGGQRMEGVRQHKALHLSAMERLEGIRREQVTALHAAMIAVDALRQKSALFASQADVLQKILSAYAEQQAKGNSSQMEVARIRALLFIVQTQQQECAAEIAGHQVQLKRMLGVSGDVRPVLPTIDKDSIEALLQAPAELRGRPDLRSLVLAAEASRHETLQQRANALPEVNLMAEWDKNGNIGRNFFAVGMGLTVPIFNRGKGSIQAARARQQQAEAAAQQSLRDAELEIDRLEQQVRTLAAIAIAGDIEAEQAALMEQVAQQYLRRNISLIEFSAHLESYRETMLAAIDSHANLQKAVAELKQAKGILKNEE